MVSGGFVILRLWSSERGGQQEGKLPEYIEHQSLELDCYTNYMVGDRTSSYYP